MRMGPKTDSRADKRQLAVYLEPEIVEQIHQRAEREQKSLEELIGEAINIAYGLFGQPGPYKVDPEDRPRLVKRREKRSQAKNHAVHPSARAGKRVVGGYFKKETAEAVRDFASDVGSSTQDFIAMGFRVMLASPAPGGAAQAA